MTIKQNTFLSLSQESPPIYFPNGLIGLEEWRQFVLISHPIGDPLCLLQSTEDEHISFIVTEPSLIIADYQVTLSASDVGVLQLSTQMESLHLTSDQAADLSVDFYCILSIQESPLYVTANLLGPLVIHREANIGRQIILSDVSYDSRHTLTDLTMPSTNTETVGG